MFVIVTQVGDARFGIVVDRVFDTEEIVIKPVAPILRNLEIFAGNTILGDGRVIMILDSAGIAVRAGLAAAVEAIGGQDDAVNEAHAGEGEGEDVTALLVFRAGSDAVRAVALSLVARLEEIDVANIEHADGRALMQYRGQLIPILTINDTCSLCAEGRQPMLIFADGEHTLGIAVDEIVDIVEDRLVITQPGQKPGVLGSAVVAGKATEILDVGHYLEKCVLGWGGKSTQKGAPPKHILLVDQNPFFRNMLLPMLSVAGYRVTTAESVDEVRKLREEGHEFDVIVSDAEIPTAEGLNFASTLKEGELWRDTPVVALTASPSAVHDVNEGFSGCVAKFDRTALLDTLSQTLAARGAA
jgi:two-component system chemotaxis sensor kinase CheA